MVIRSQVLKCTVATGFYEMVVGFVLMLEKLSQCHIYYPTPHGSLHRYGFWCNSQTIFFSVVYHPLALSSQQREGFVDSIISAASERLCKRPTAKLFLCGEFDDLGLVPLQRMLWLTQMVTFTARGEHCLAKNIH